MPKLTANSFDDPAWAIATQGWEAYAKDKLGDAIASYTKALNSFTEHTPTAAIMETYICRGAAFGRAGNQQAAIDDFTKAIELNPQSEMAFYDRGISRQTLGQFDCAIDDFSRVIELRTQYASGFIRRGVCRKRLDDVPGARSDFAEAKRLIAAAKPTDRKPKPRYKRLADVPMRFPPPPGTKFYICFQVHVGEDPPPYEEMLTIVADSPEDAIEQILRDGKGPTDPQRRHASVRWFNHNGGVRARGFWLPKNDGDNT